MYQLWSRMNQLYELNVCPINDQDLNCKSQLLITECTIAWGHHEGSALCKGSVVRSNVEREGGGESRNAVFDGGNLHKLFFYRWEINEFNKICWLWQYERIQMRKRRERLWKSWPKERKSVSDEKTTINTGFDPGYGTKCREITTLFWLQIQCIELPNTVTENVVKCRTLESEGECDRLGLRAIPQNRARSRKRDELGRRTKERRSLANQEERDAALWRCHTTKCIWREIEIFPTGHT
jgi:hypothetical protein